MNNKKTFYSAGAIIILVLIVVAGYWFATKNSENDLTANTPPSNGSPIVTPVAPTTDTVYENDYMKVSVPEGWVIDYAGNTTKANAINITKGNYILYINPQAGQASGVRGGRFAEIAMGAPSADAVVIEQPSPPCGQEVVGDANVRPSPPSDMLNRKDLYVSSANKTNYCAVPTNGKTVWYFSYLTDYMKGYINYFKAGEAPGYVITMSYNSKDVNAFPAKGAPELDSALTEMTSIVKTLQLKQWGKQTR